MDSRSGMVGLHGRAQDDVTIIDYKANLAKQSKHCPVILIPRCPVSFSCDTGMKEIEKAKLISKTTSRTKT